MFGLNPTWAQLRHSLTESQINILEIPRRFRICLELPKQIFPSIKKVSSIFYKLNLYMVMALRITLMF